MCSSVLVRRPRRAPAEQLTLLRREGDGLDDAGVLVGRCCHHPPLTKRRPSGSSARESHEVCVVHEGAQDGAVVDVEELDGAVVRHGLVGRRARVGCRAAPRGRTHSRCAATRSEACSCVPSRNHTRTVWSRPPLRMRWPSGIAATARTKSVCPLQVLTRLLVATLHTLTRLSSEPLMMCWPSRVTATAKTGPLCPVEGVDERPVDAVHQDRAGVFRRVANADHKVNAVRQRRESMRDEGAQPEGALERAVECPQLHEAFVRKAGEARSARQHPHTLIRPLCALDGVRARAVAPHLDGLVERVVITWPSGAAVTASTELVCPASVTTSPENGRNLRASFAASQSAWHVGATAAMSWASGSW